jgi:membrane protein involved in colicin uptake
MANSTADTPGVSETKLAKMRIKDLREHARERGIEGADDLHKPELLLMVKDWHYARAHGGQHRPDAPAAARNGTKKRTDAKKTDVKKAEAKKADAKKAEAKKAEAKKAETKKAEVKKAETKKADAKKAETKKADAKKSDARKSGSKKIDLKKSGAGRTTSKKIDLKKSGAEKTDRAKDGGRDDARRAVDAIRHRLTQIDGALTELEADLR